MRAVGRCRIDSSRRQSLVELGFNRTTGVEICKRAELTRGALNHHCPDLAELYSAALLRVYESLGSAKEQGSEARGPLEDLVLRAYQQIVQPEFKVVIELWLASRNDPEFGTQLGGSIANGASLFAPESVLPTGPHTVDPGLVATYRMLQEALIGLGLGRVVNAGVAVSHELQVLEQLLQIAKAADANTRDLAIEET